MRKTTLLLIAFLILTNSLIHSSSNKLFYRQDPLYKAAYALCVANGVLPPTSVSPMTGYEIKAAIDEIPDYELSQDERNMKSWILNEIDEPMMLQGKHVGFSPIIRLSPEFYFYSEDASDTWNPLDTLKDVSPFMTVGFRLELGKIGYAFGKWGIISPEIEEEKKKLTFSWNAQHLSLLDHDEMMDSGLLLGNEFIYGGIFRTRQEMGYGRTGNLIVGDNFSYQDFLRMAIRSEWFDYTLNLTHFDSAKPFDGKGTDIELLRQKFNGMHQFQTVHHFEFKLFDQLQIMLQEAVIINSTSSFDIRFLSPFIYFHSLYTMSGNTNYDPGNTHDEINNYTTAEISWTAYKHLRFNFQLLMDQIQTAKDNEDPNVLPQAYGALLNIETPWIKGEHYATGWFESVMIMPFTYLNQKKNENNLYDTNLDMIVGYKNKNKDEIGYAGYTWGPDCLIFSLGVDFGIPDKYDASISVNYLMHGENGYSYENIITKTGDEYFSMLPLNNFKAPNYALLGIIDISVNFSTFLSFTLYSNVYIEIESILKFRNSLTINVLI